MSSGPITVTRFLGIAPKIEPTLLNTAQAQTALNTRLWSEGLRPFKGWTVSEQLSKTGNIQTVYRFNNDQTWLHWTENVNVARTAVANDKLEKTVFTGADVPRITTNELWDDGSPGTSLPPASYILGLPAPDTAPVATDTGAGTITATCGWVFTFVRKWSDGSVDESAPSPVSNSLTLSGKKASVTLPNGAMASPTLYGITHKRLYRSQGGNYFYSGEAAIGDASLEDNVATQSLGDAISTTLYLPPPDDAEGVIVLPNGIMAMFKGNNVYLSEPYRPHAYPLQNQYAMNWPIVGLANVGTSILVLTTAYPSIGRGVDPAGYSFKKEPGILPCMSRRGIASSEYGVLWPSPSGMALFDGTGTKVITKEFLTRDEWQRDYYPDTIHGVVHDGHYFGWFQTGTDVDGRKLGGGFVLDKTERAFLFFLSDYVDAAYVIPERAELWLARRNSLGQTYMYQWDANPGDPFTYTWKSKEFITNGLENFGFAQIIAEFNSGLSPADEAAILAQIAAAEAYNAAQARTFGEVGGMMLNEGMVNGDSVLIQPPSVDDYVVGAVTFTYWADDDLKLTRDVIDSEPFPLPSGFRAETHAFQLTGKVAVTQVTLARTVEELAQ